MNKALTIARCALIASLLLFPSLARAQYSQTANGRLPAKTLQGQTLKNKGPVMHLTKTKTGQMTHLRTLKRPN
jgi:hypothetical protein